MANGTIIEWEVQKRLEMMTPEEIDGMSLSKYEVYEEGRMERNAWMVVEEVQNRLDDAPVLSEYITAYKLQKIENMFFFNEEHLSSYQKCTSDNARKKVPGSCYIEKITNFQKIHCKPGELLSEFIREGCREHLDGTLSDYCSSHHWIGHELSRLPQPVLDQANPPHFLPVWRTPLNNDQGKPRSVGDYQPWVQIYRLFKSGSLDLENNGAIENFSMQYAMDSDLVRKAILLNTFLTSSNEKISK